ncbi:Lrp/AsnC family transcriptional regulator [Texcoconibacillus texcoconensis]|uniref:Lrp/AsnC family transcriptional regulator for asnA, asnC and gidA n=1 Tax=Texcoconibacillus texcoconensis TaxID=1095777 RepID=A0A840QTE3_9BACI|nr:Lrp/AsnC family transcriptional regulator [Texcoconibacillus texcoconensis]MBB5174583.1 Lrp/AsnC family transcriptional regulator for asnA, asnC and gidA [Texcoconibacillus texcoconensis]
MFDKMNEDFSIDQLDRQIVEILQKDGRISYTELSEQLDTTASTIRNRVQRLTDNNFIKVVGVVNPFLTGMETVAFIGVKIDLPKYDDIVEALRKIPEVRFIAGASGGYDLFIQVITTNNMSLFQIIRQDISDIDGIASLETHMLFDIHKQTYDWGTGQDKV